VGLRDGLNTEARGKIVCLCRGPIPIAQSVDRHYAEISSSHGGEYDVQNCLHP
jgi:hypothetical protein